jgi:cysteine synthase
MTAAHSTLDYVGNTPVVQLQKLAGPESATVVVKLEYFSPTGSYKDRMAKAIIEGAEARGDLQPGQTVLEVTGGSTGSSLALICAQKGYPIKLVTSDAFASEKLKTMAAFGAELIIEPSDNGQITPDLLDRMLARASKIENAQPVYRTDQFHNQDAFIGYGGIATELLAQVDEQIDVFCGAVGTAGMLMGVSRGFQEHGANVRIIALEPASSPLLSEGRMGSHRVEGMAVMLHPPLMDADAYDEVRSIEEGVARETARNMARQEGIFAGTSSGLNVAAAIQIARELGPGHTVATVACDSGLKYLDGDLYQA